MGFEAKYRGQCANDCGSPIWPGDSVKYGVGARLVHIDCRPKVERPVTICPVCHLQKPCGCVE